MPTPNLLGESVSALNPTFWGAFLGATFAFIFGLLNLWVTKKRECFIQHKGALVKLEQLLHEHYDEIGIAKECANSVIAAIGDEKIPDNRFNLFRTPTDIPLELKSIKLINEYFEYSRRVIRINTNLAAKNHAVNRFEDAAIAGRSIHDNTNNKDFMVSSINKILEGLEDLERKVLRLKAIERIYIDKVQKNKNFFEQIFFREWDLNISGEIISERINQ